MNITGKQIKAARVLLDWSREDLAAASGIAVSTIGGYERSGVKTYESKSREMIRVLEAHGIEFIESGVRERLDIVRDIEGPDCYLELLDDVFLTLRDVGGEWLLSACDESRCTPEVIEKTKAMRRSGIPMRSLIRSGDTHILGSLNEYRWMDEGLFVDGDVKVIYGSKVAYLVTWLETQRVIILNDERIAQEARRHFDFVWESSQLPTHTTACYTYESEGS